MCLILFYLDARSKSYNDDLRLNKAKRLRTSPFNGGYNPYSSHHQNLFMLPGHHRGAGGGPPGGAHPSLALLQSIQDSHKYFHSVQGIDFSQKRSLFIILSSLVCLISKCFSVGKVGDTFV